MPGGPRILTGKMEIFFLTSAPVARMPILRKVSSLIADHDFGIHILDDIDAASLNSLVEYLFVKLPAEFSRSQAVYPSCPAFDEASLYTASTKVAPVGTTFLITLCVASDSRRLILVLQIFQ